MTTGANDTSNSNITTTAEFKSPKFKVDWLSAVTRFATPKIGEVNVADMTMQDIVSVLDLSSGGKAADLRGGTRGGHFGE